MGAYTSRIFSQERAAVKLSFSEKVLISMQIKRTQKKAIIFNVKGYDQRYKWCLVAFMTLVTIFLTPEMIARMGFNSYGSISQLCDLNENKATSVYDLVADISGLPQARGQYTEGEILKNWSVKLLTQDETNLKLTSTGRVGKLYSPTTGCPPRDVNINTQCSTNKICETAHIRVCLFIKVPVTQCFQMTTCNSKEDTADVEYNRKVAEFNRDLNRPSDVTSRSNNTDVIPEEFQTSTQKYANIIINQVNWLSFAYNGYMILGFIFAPPLLIYSRPIMSQFSAMFGASKYYFILFGIILWNLVAFARSPEAIKVYAQFNADPCLVDPRYANLVRSQTVAVCSEIETLRTAWGNTTAFLNRKYAFAQSFVACNDYIAPFKPYPSATIAAPGSNNLSISWNNATDFISGSFDAKCDMDEIREAAFDPATLKAHGSSVNGVNTFLVVCIFLQLLLPNLLNNTAYYFVGCYHPFATCNGCIEGTEKEKEDFENSEHACREEWEDFLVAKHSLLFILSSILLLFATIGAIYGGVNSNIR